MENGAEPSNELPLDSATSAGATGTDQIDSASLITSKSKPRFPQAATLKFAKQNQARERLVLKHNLAKLEIAIT